MTPNLITAVANTAGVLMPANTFRNGAYIENPLASPVYIDQSSNPAYAPPSMTIPPVDVNGIPGFSQFPGNCTEQWYYKTAASGNFTLWTW